MKWLYRRGDIFQFASGQGARPFSIRVNSSSFPDVGALISTKFVGRARRGQLLIARNGACAVKDVIIGVIHYPVREVRCPTVHFIAVNDEPFFNGRSNFKGRFPGNECGLFLKDLIRVECVVIHVFFLRRLPARAFPLFLRGVPNFANCATSDLYRHLRVFRVLVLFAVHVFLVGRPPPLTSHPLAIFRACIFHVVVFRVPNVSANERASAIRGFIQGAFLQRGRLRLHEIQARRRRRDLPNVVRYVRTSAFLPRASTVFLRLTPHVSNEDGAAVFIFVAAGRNLFFLSLQDFHFLFAIISAANRRDSNACRTRECGLRVRALIFVDFRLAGLGAGQRCWGFLPFLCTQLFHLGRLSKIEEDRRPTDQLEDWDQ